MTPLSYQFTSKQYITTPIRWHISLTNTFPRKITKIITYQCIPMVYKTIHMTYSRKGTHFCSNYYYFLWDCILQQTTSNKTLIKLPNQLWMITKFTLIYNKYHPDQMICRIKIPLTYINHNKLKFVILHLLPEHNITYSDISHNKLIKHINTLTEYWIYGIICL